MKELPLLHQDEHLIVVNKPAGVLSVPADKADEQSLPSILRAQGLEVFPVHRLDREVSGAIVFARSELARSALEQLFRDFSLEKTYWALASGRVRPAEGKWHFPILEEREAARVSARGKSALTLYKTLRSYPTVTELEIRLETGRRNQIRLHAAHSGFPLVGERKYARGRDSALKLRSRRVALHAWRLAFVHPLTSIAIAVEAPLPADLCELLEAARGRRTRPHER